jgi:prophage antirepressor-like protein
MSTLRTTIVAKLKRRKIFNKLVEGIDMPKNEIMWHLIQNAEGNPLTKGKALRQIKKNLGIEKNWQVLSSCRVLSEKEILSFENMRTEITKTIEHEQCTNTKSVIKIENNSHNFTFAPSNQTIRVEIINGELWFVAKDVCNTLSISNNRDAVSRLDDDEKATSVLPTQFGDKEMHLVNESGLYSLIFQSRKPEAKVFRKWVTSEVLPALRKTGAYRIKGKRNHNSPVPAGSGIAQLLQLIADNLQKGDQKAIATQLGVKQASISNILSGKTKSSTMLQALYDKALDNKLNGFVNAYSGEFVATAITKLT